MSLKYRQAITEAIAEEMSRDESVVLFGEDVAAAGGTFAATKGLLERFGPNRVRDTPISEAVLTGLATGAAMTGLRPIVEIMYFDFMTLASDQLVNHAAKVRSVSGGEFSVPMVVRTMSGAGRNSGPQHSQNLEGWLAQVPGLKVVAPATPADVKGLLKSAVRDPDPVIVIESQLLWGQVGPVGGADELVPIGSASVARPGRDLTVVVWSGMLPRALAAAQRLADEDGASVEVLDLRSLSPLDEDAVLASARRTGRVLVAHDAVGSFGPGAEIAALVADRAFDALRAPVRRVTAPFAPVPQSTALELGYYPQTDTLVSVARDLLARG
jgi:pyruvate/2-oxoglutarate/acetoin dehydrogenase E1 component